jgi:hypothetical protein
MASQVSSSDSESTSDCILKEILARKTKQATKKTQPWKGIYVPEAADQPKTTSPHDRPWIENEKAFSWGNEGYDTDSGKT